MLPPLPAKQLTRSRWLKNPINSGKYRKWLIENGSLTQRLQNVGRQHQQVFSVHPTLLVNVKPSLDETYLLQQKPCLLALQREVNLYCGNQCVVFAHSILPHQSLKGEWLSLGRLGTKPLGGVLFGNPRVKRIALTFKKINKYHYLYKRVMANDHITSHELWARRSVFYLKNARILVTEVFLPEVLNLI